jgi:hypothetical protein
MTVCNVCHRPLFERDQLAFLCEDHAAMVPEFFMERYVKAAKAVQQARRREGSVPPALVETLATRWREASAFARLRAKPDLFHRQEIAP